MAENIHIDLSEETVGQLKGRYQSFCGGLATELGKMVQELVGICQGTGYKPMVDVVNNTIELFNGELREKADSVFEEWKEGEGSFSAVAENSQSGDDALATAQQIESDIKDIFDSFWGSQPLGEEIEGIDTSRPTVKSEDFDNLKGIYSKYQGDVVENISEETIKNLEGEGSDNPTYNIIIPAVKAITEPIKNFFEHSATKIDEAKEGSETLKKNQDSRNEEASETATQTAATASEIAESLKMFDDI